MATTTGTGPADWRAAIHELAAIERPSASEGERQAAELIAGRLRALGCQVAVEEERAHGTYWWPIGLANLLSLGAGIIAVRGRPRTPRVAAALVSAACAAGVWDDLGQGRRWFRSLLPRRPTYNVVAETGDHDAPRTVVLIAHHDAAHSGLVFHPAMGRIPPRLTPRLHERSTQSLPILYGVFLGPLLISIGALLKSRRLTTTGLLFALGATAAMADIGARPVVAGANDNLAAVGVLVALAKTLRQRPLSGLRVLLVSTGSEESFSEGMEAFGRRHFPELEPSSTEMLCLECLGGPTLVVIEGEGMLRMRHYPQAMRDALAAAAARAQVPIKRGLRTVAATDALVALREGYPVVTLASVDYTKLPLNYHWPSDVPDALHWQTIEDATAVCERFLRSRAGSDRLDAPAPDEALTGPERQ
jgi:hypothetical protein